MEAGTEQRLPELKLDSRQAQGFISFFRSLPQDGNTIRFFDRKEYFTVHGPAALFVARCYYKTISAVRQLGSASDGIPSVTVNNSMFESILKDTLLSSEGGNINNNNINNSNISASSTGGVAAAVIPERYFAVEVYEGTGGTWRLVKAGTPGKLGAFEEALFGSGEMGDSPTVVAVAVGTREGERRVGLAFMDLTRRTVGYTEFIDDEQYTNVEAAVVALGCKECVVPLESGKNSSDGKRLRDVMSRCDVPITERKKSEFKARDAEGDLLKLVKAAGDATSASIESELAAAAVAALLAYTEVLGDDSNYGKYALVPYSLGTHMRLDAGALRALNVVESKTDTSKSASLMGLLNRTCTAGMGRRLLNRWIKQPLVDPEDIRGRLDVVQAFVESSELRQEIRQHLKRMPDVERLARKLEMRRANLFDVVKLYQASVRLPHLRDVLTLHGGHFVDVLKERYTNGMQEWCGPHHLAKYEGLVEAAVDLEELERGEYLISPSYDASLGEIKAEREEVEKEIQKVFSKAALDLGLVVDKTLKLDKTAQSGYVFRISKKEETNVRKKLSASFMTLETRKDGVKFTNPKLRRLSERYLSLSESYSETQRALVTKVVEVASTFVEVFEAIASLLADLDVLQSFADLSASAPIPYVRPSISGPDEGDIVLEACRHPCVEVQDDVSFIPNDCRLVRGSSWFQIITGPNMGGKSTFIRQVGVNVLMAQIGCFVPCNRAQISVRDAIFARVGAGDCQLRGVSTFMAEMLETATILKCATPRSLVIIDELGRGTSTYDGFGLAWAICEHLVDITRAPTLFATHFHELTALEQRKSVGVGGEQTSSGVANCHVSAHIDETSRKLTMLYQVEPGPCDQSFGIHVAEFARFPPQVVEMARLKAHQLEDFTPSSASKILSNKDDGAGMKRKRVSALDESEQGAVRAKQFLKDFAALPIDKMSPDEAMKATSALVQDLKKDAEGNPWLNTLVQ